MLQSILAAIGLSVVVFVLRTTTPLSLLECVAIVGGFGLFVVSMVQKWIKPGILRMLQDMRLNIFTDMTAIVDDQTDYLLEGVDDDEIKPPPQNKE